MTWHAAVAIIGITCAAIILIAAINSLLHSDRVTIQPVPPPDEAAPQDAADCSFCGDLSQMGDPLKCECKQPCGRPWCTRLRDLIKGNP